MSNIDNKIISTILKDLGVTPGLHGYAYLRKSVQLATEDMSIVHRLTKDLYPTVARQFGTTPSRVERDIRHAVETSWAPEDCPFQHEVFGSSVSASRSKPTNGEFIATVADYLLINS